MMTSFSKADERRNMARWSAVGSAAAAVAIGSGLAAVMMGAGIAQATPLTEGSILPNYAIVSVGPKASLTINSGPINGDILVGDGSGVTTSGGNNGGLTAGHHADESGTVTGSFSGLQNPPTVNTVAASIGTTAFSDAQTLATNAASLTPSQSYASTVSGPLTINGTGGLDVIDFTSLQNPVLTINGNASDAFVFNVSGSLNTNEVMTLNGVTASQILWNFTGTSGNVFQTSGGDVLYGTFLATAGGDFQFSNLDLTGQLINTGGHIQDVSGSFVPTFAPLTQQQEVPEPGSLALFGSALASFGGLSFWRRRRVRV